MFRSYFVTVSDSAGFHWQADCETLTEALGIHTRPYPGELSKLYGVRLCGCPILLAERIG